MQGPAWAVVDRELAGSVEVGGIVVAIWREAGRRTLLLEAVMPKKSRTSVRPVDSGTTDVNVARERASAFAAELGACGEAPGTGEDRVQKPVYHELALELERRRTDVQNRKTQLRAWMRIFRFEGDDLVGDEFGTAFDIYMQKFRDRLEQEGKAPATIHSYISRIRDVRAIAAEIRHVRTDGLTFGEALDAAIRASGLTHAQIARETGVSGRSISVWRTGLHQPRETFYPKVIALELLLGQKPGTLTGLLGPARPEGERVLNAFSEVLRGGRAARGLSVRRFAAILGIPVQTVNHWLRGGNPGPMYRDRVGGMEEVLQLPAGSLEAVLPPLRPCFLRYSAELTPGQQGEWERLLSHKTARDEDDEDRRPADYWRVKKDGRCPSGEMYYTLLRQFYGCLVLPADAADPLRRGLGMELEGLSLLNLANRDHVQFFVRFLARRAGGYNSQTVHVIQFARSLLRPRTGFLHQAVDIDWRAFPASEVDATVSAPGAVLTLDQWRAHCSAVLDRLGNWLNHLESTNLVKRTRDYAHIESILRLDRPTKVLVLLERRMRAYIAKKWPRATPAARAKLARDLLLVCLINRNPLRQSHWQCMKFRSRNGEPAHLVKLADGAYRLRFELEDFKAVSKMREEDYEADIDCELTAFTDEYLTVHRPHLSGAEMCDYVFRPSRGRKGDHAQQMAVSVHLVSITAFFLPEYAPRGFGSHAWRHIIATDLVKNHVDGIQLAADALHNTVEMIERHYGHLRSSDRTKRTHRIISDALTTGAKELDEEKD